MESKVVILALIAATVLSVLLVGCAPEETTESQVQDLDSELSDLESLSEDIENFSLELNETELEELEGMF